MPDYMEPSARNLICSSFGAIDGPDCLRMIRQQSPGFCKQTLAIACLPARDSFLYMGQPNGDVTLHNSKYFPKRY